MSEKHPRHLILGGPEVVEGVQMGTIHHEDGTQETILYSADEAVIKEHGIDDDISSYCLEPCPDPRADSRTVHAFKPDETGHRGPAWVSSRAFCEGWELTFGSGSKTDGGIN